MINSQYIKGDKKPRSLAWHEVEAGISPEKPQKTQTHIELPIMSINPDQLSSATDEQKPRRLLEANKEEKFDNANPVFSEDGLLDEFSGDYKPEDLNLVSQPESPKSEGERGQEFTEEKHQIDNNADEDKAESPEEPYQICVTLWDYIKWILFRSESVKPKMALLTKGTRKINSRLDIITILKKMREIDKLRAMLFDSAQRVLYENLPKPELRPDVAESPIEDALSPYAMLRKFSFDDNGIKKTDLIFESRAKIERKRRKTVLDERFISVFKEK